MRDYETTLPLSSLLENLRAAQEIENPQLALSIIDDAFDRAMDYPENRGKIYHAITGIEHSWKRRWNVAIQE